MKGTSTRYKAELQRTVNDEENGQLTKADDLKKQIGEWD